MGPKSLPHRHLLAHTGGMRLLLVALTAGLALWASPAVAHLDPLSIRDQERTGLLGEIEDWKVFLSNNPQDPLTQRFIPELRVIKVRVEEPQADLVTQQARLDAWKERLLAELRSRAGTLDSGEFLKTAERQRELLVAIRNLKRRNVDEGQLARLEALKAKIKTSRDLSALESLRGQVAVETRIAAMPRQPAPPPIRALPGSVIPPAAQPRRLVPAPEPPAPGSGSGTPGMSPGSLAEVKTYLLDHGARRGILGQTIEDVMREAGARDMDPALVLAVILQESHFNPRAKSPLGARGLMQIMRETGASLGLRTESDFYNPLKNVRAGIRYLRDMMARMGGNIKNALAAYNAGPGAVEKHRGVPPFTETRRYVRKVYDAYLDLKGLITVPAVAAAERV